MATEKLANNAVSALSGAIASGDTTIVVNAATPFPTTGNFRLLVDGEIMLVTSVNSNTFTVNRAQESTTASSHVSGSVVSQVLTRAALLQFESEQIQRGADASLPSAERAGRLYLPSDGPMGRFDDGSNWNPFGPVHPLTKPPLAASWTDAFGCATLGSPPITITDTTAGPLLKTSGLGTASFPEQMAGFLKSLAFSTPYTITAAFMLYVGSNADYAGAGIVLASSATPPKLKAWMRRVDNNANNPKFLFDARYNPGPYTHAAGGSETFCIAMTQSPLVWLRIADNGTTRTFSFSADGVNFFAFQAEPSATDFTPTRVGLCLWSNTSDNIIMSTCVSFTEVNS